MSAHEPAARTGGCPRLELNSPHGTTPVQYGLATCTKYNVSPPRGIPEKGEEICARPGSSPANCWMDFFACRKAEIAERAFNRSFLGQRDPLGEPQAALAYTDPDGRQYYCIQRNGQWVHGGEHDFPVGGPTVDDAAARGVRRGS